MAPKPKLTERAIAEKALELIDAEGVDALTMRRLATELRTGPMSLYNYFADKDALLEAVTQLVLAEIEAPSEELGWKDTVLRIMRSARAAGLRHPHVVPLMERYPPRTIDALAFVEAGFRAFRRAGFDDASIARSYSALAAYSFGTLAVEVNRYFAVHPAVRQNAESLDAASMSRLLPNITQVGPTLAAQDDTAQFEYGLQLILTGFEQTTPHRLVETAA
jgi:AcrR family transcriptional regulator